MQLAARRPDSESFDLDGHVGAVLDLRLEPGAGWPVAVAFSGGGDSLALLLASAAWARRTGRPLLVLTVDHRLRSESAGWTDACAETAHRLGLAFQALSWEGDKPATGLPAAARLARHRLLAGAARSAGARVILMGHTADDVLEAAAMRQAGATTPTPAPWSPSPVWPDGRGLFLLRPLLDVRRATLREALERRGESWIDDPANADLRYARPRARRLLAAGAIGPGTPAVDAPPSAALAWQTVGDGGGGLSLPRTALREVAHATAQRFVAAACLCTAGTDRPPSAARAARLTERLRATELFTASLAGARVEAQGATVRFLREPGEAQRGGLSTLRVAAGETVVWDGRFAITADRPGEIRPLAGLGGRLPPPQRAWRQSLPAGARDAAPAMIDSAGEIACPVGETLTYARLLAACGAVTCEPTS